MECKSCGFPLNPDEVTCPNCGTPTGITPRASAPTYEQPRRQPQHSPAEYEQPQQEQPRRQPQYSQPEYEQPQQEQPRRQPQYSQPEYEQPQYERPQYEQPRRQPQYSQPQATLDPEQPDYSLLQYDQRQYQQEQYDEEPYRHEQRRYESYRQDPEPPETEPDKKKKRGRKQKEKKEAVESSWESEEKPLGMLAYLGYEILFLIPLIGQVLMIFYSLGGTKNPHLRNFARSFLCLVVLLVAVALALLMYFGGPGVQY
jgi:hypothetical protein